MLEPDMDPFGGGDVTGTGGLDWLVLPFLIVPALMAAMGLHLAWSALREDAVVKRLLQQPPVPGTVVSAHVVHRGGRSNGGRNSTAIRSTLVETIEYRTPTGQVVRGNPLVANPGAVDRTGMTVPVHADPARPERFIAPAAGAPATGTGARVLMGLGVAVSALAFAWFATRLIGSSPF